MRLDRLPATDLGTKPDMRFGYPHGATFAAGLGVASRTDSTRARDHFEEYSAKLLCHVRPENYD